MGEWSKALVEGTSHFGGVGSNPTAVKFSVFRSKLPLIINFTYNHLNFISMKWSKALVLGTSDFVGLVLSIQQVLINKSIYVFLFLLHLIAYQDSVDEREWVSSDQF